MRRICLAILIAIVAALPARAEPVARVLDPEEIPPGMDIAAGLVFRLPGNALLLLEDGPAIAADFSVILVAEPDTSVAAVFGSQEPVRVIVTAWAGEVVYAGEAGCIPAPETDGVLDCTAGGEAAFSLDRTLAAPDLAFTLRAPLALADDLENTEAGRVTLVPLPGEDTGGPGQGWSLLLAPVNGY